MGTVSSGLNDSGSAFAGGLLVATPLIDEPTFRRAVILMLEHSAEGSLGVVLNDDAEIDVVEVIPDWSAVLAPSVAAGGPVQTDAGVAVAWLRPQMTADPPAGVRVISGAWAVVDLDAPPESLQQYIADGRLFLGYAGWGPGQLDAELDMQSWWVVESRPDDLQWGETGDRSVAWREVLLRQPNDLRLAATFPEDPSWN